MRSTTTLVAGAVSVVLAVGVGACGAEPQVLEAGEVRLLVAGAREGSGDAQIVGTLVLAPGGCVAVRSAEGWTNVVAWPQRTALHDDGTIDVAGRTFRVGDQLDAAGSYVDFSSESLPGLPGDCESGELAELAVIDQASSIR